MGAARKALQRPFPSLDRRTAQIFAVEFEQIETAEYRGRAMLLAAHDFENRKSALVNVCLTVDHARSRRELGNRQGN